MSEFGIKIKNINAAMLYEVNLGVRDYFEYTEAMLSNSLFNDYMKKNGMSIYNGESTRDIVCLNFDFGSKSYEKEIKRLRKLLSNTHDTELITKIKNTIALIDSKKGLYSEKKREELRQEYYKNGVDITYKQKNRKGEVHSSTIHYKMLYRTSAKAKLGQVIFIKSRLYTKAYDWLTVGLGKEMPKDNAKIVEMSAYAPLTTSTIVDRMYIPVEDIVILKDQDSVFKTIANIVKASNYTLPSGEVKKKCVVETLETEVVNTLWDGMGLIDSSIFPQWANGMALLRNHLFKMCGFNTNIQLFFKNWCIDNNKDYNTYQIKDMFGYNHFMKDIKVITTDNSIKWKKFIDIMGGNPESAYKYWCSKINDDGCVFGVVKTDHPSKLGDYQQLSYQMINTLPCSKEDITEITKDSREFINLLKNDDSVFEQYLKDNADVINDYEMLADLYNHNHKFAESKFFKSERQHIISNYMKKIRKGKIWVNGDNLTACGNPYELLLYSVGEDYEKLNTFSTEDDSIQCYTPRFNDKEYLASFRNPHNSPNNILYFHNIYNERFDKYFNFSKNIIAINCIHTDIQSRANGEDFDSDFNLTTNQPNIVECARKCYKEYPTIVNDLKESGISYKNQKEEYAKMDNKFAKSKTGIGWSSNLAQLAMTYYWTEKNKENPDKERLKSLYDNFVILSVVAQCIIDGCKREYEINGDEEVVRISGLDCMQITQEIRSGMGDKMYLRKDLPYFMKYIKEVKPTKNGNIVNPDELSENRFKIHNRINYNLQCPMNWFEDSIDTVKQANHSPIIPNDEFVVKIDGKVNYNQINKILTAISECDKLINQEFINNSDSDLLHLNIMLYTQQMIDEILKIKINNIATMNKLICLALDVDRSYPDSIKQVHKQTLVRCRRKILNSLYKTNRNNFILNFV